MPTYVLLVNYTEQGVKKIKDSPQRLDAGRKMAKKLGVELKSHFLTLGGYDNVDIIEAPDDQAVAKFALSLASLGNVRTTTLKAFNEAEYRDIIGALP